MRICTFREMDDTLTDNHELLGAIIFSSKGWKEKEGGYDILERTYVFSGDNKAFKPECGGYSCFAGDLRGVDVCIRLEQYWMEWEKVACFILEKGEVDKFKELIVQLE